jgi:hypothetical protein
VWRNWFFKGQAIYSNIHLFKIPYYYLSGVNQLDEIRNGYVLLDELWLLVDSRMSRSSKNIFVANILSKSRKRDLTYISTAQVADSIETRIRKVLDFTFYPLLNREETICFKQGTLIVCDSEIKNIEDIIIGDKTLTHAGNFKEVKNIHIRNYKGKILRILPDYMRIPVEVTPNHPIYVAEPIFKESSKMEWHKDQKYLEDNFFTETTSEIAGKLNRSCGSVGNRKVRMRDDIKFNYKWKSAEDLEKTDLLAYPIIKKIEDRKEIRMSNYLEKMDFKLSKKDFVPPKHWKWGGKKYYEPKSWSKNFKGWLFDGKIWKNNRSGVVLNDTVKIDKNFMKLAGYYIGDGSTMGYASSAIHLDKNDKIGQKETKELFKLVFGIKAVSINHKIHHETHVIIYNKIIRLFLMKLFGSGAKNKKMPEWFLLLPRDKIEFLIKGLLNSDGYKRKNGVIDYVTVSKILAIQVAQIAMKTGRRFNIYSREPVKNSIIKGKEKIYNVILGASYSKSLFFDGEYVLFPIKKIEEIDFEGNVYNLEVEDDNSYVTSSLSAHNCKTLIFRTGYVKPQHYMKSFYYKTALVKLMYDSNEEVKTEEESKETLRACFQESFDPKHGYLCECDDCGTKFFDKWEDCEKHASAYYKKNIEKIKQML